MNFNCLSAEEIRTRYRLADNKKEIITVLADLTCSSKAEMRKFLGVEKPSSKPLTRLDRDKAMEYYEAGMSDEEIAERLGVHRCTVGNWRRINGLSFNQVDERLIDDEKERMELYKQGLNDSEIGDALHLSPATICSWRHRRGLPCNVRQGQYDRKKMKG